MILVIIVAGIGSFCSSISTTITCARISRNLTYDLFLSVINKDIEFFDSNKTGEIMSRMTSDVQEIRDGLTHTFQGIISSLIKLVMVIIILFIISTKLTRILLTFVLIISVLCICIGVYVGKLEEKVQEKKAEMSQIAEEAFSNARTVKAFACEGYEIKRYVEKNKEAYDIAKKRIIIKTFGD